MVAKTKKENSATPKAEQKSENQKTPEPTWAETLNRNSKLILITQVILAIYLNLFLIAWGMFTFDVATLNFGFIKKIFGLKTLEYTEPMLLILLALAGGGIGGAIFGIQKLRKYAVKDGFKMQFVGDYVFRQFGSAALGAIIFALVVSGLFNSDQFTNSPLTSDVQPTSAATAAPATEDGQPTASDSGTAESAPQTQSPLEKRSGYFAFGIGFLAGFGSYQVTRKLDDIVKLIFGRLRPDDLNEDDGAITSKQGSSA